MEEIRNFTIIAHINHGKSTLADRFLELTKTIDKKEMLPQYLDTLDLEREKEITIKMHPVRMAYILNSNPYILDLIDTPGHVDFSYEVSRSLAAVEGAILLVDATKGIQAQTVYNLEQARKQNLVIIPVINKIDLPHAKIEETSQELSELLKVPQEDIIKVSAKEGTNVEQVLKAIIEKVPQPKIDIESVFQALIFDSKYDSFKGVIVFTRVFSGKIKPDSKIFLVHSGSEGEVKELGYFKPHLEKAEELKSGEIGYIATGIKETEKVRVGDTLGKLDQRKIKALSGYQIPTPVVFASLYPQKPEDFESLKTALLKLQLIDPSLTFEPETREALGRGFRCGFLGNLHIEIIIERLKREFGLELVISTPSVIFKIIDKKGKEHLIFNPADWPQAFQIQETQEPWVRLEILTPINFLGQVLKILEDLGGKYIEKKHLSTERVLLIYEVPLREIIVGFYDKLKNFTQGFASMNYEILGYRKEDLVKLEILIAKQKEEAFSKIISKSKAYDEGQKMVKKLKKILPAQLFSVSLQAAISGRIIARETIRAKRKDVIAPLYGGDYTRKRKLLEKQKKGKAKLKEIGKIRVPHKVFLEMFKS